MIHWEMSITMLEIELALRVKQALNSVYSCDRETEVEFVRYIFRLYSLFIQIQFRLHAFSDFHYCHLNRNILLLKINRNILLFK